MLVVQIDGLSGTGKSTLRDELARRGYEAIDADAEFGYFGDSVTGLPNDFQIRQNWIWDVGRLREFCSQPHDAPVFICGGAMNQDQCSELFTHRLLLCIDSQTMRLRLLARTSNTYGKNPAELAEQLGLNRRPEWTGRRPGWIVVDATQPIGDVADEVIRQCVSRQ